MVLATSRTYRYLHLSEPLPGEIEVSFDQVVHCSYEISHIASCYKQWIITYSPDRTLRVLSLEGKLELEVRKPGRVTASLNSECFFVVADLEVVRVREITTQEKVDWLINRKSFHDALDLLRTQSSAPQTTRLCKEWLQHTLSTETEAAARKLCCQLIDTGRISQKNVLELICADSLLLPLLTEIANTDVTLQEAHQLLPSLLQRGDEQLLIFCVRNWTLSLLNDDLLVQPLLCSALTETKFELFKRRGQLEAAFDMLLTAKLSRIFRALRDYPEDAANYMSKMNSRQIAVLCEIDTMEAIELLVGRDDMSQDRLLQILPVAVHLTYANRLLKEGKRRSTKVDLILLEEDLKRSSEEVVSFLHNSCLQVNLQALELCQRYSHIEGQILILSRLGRIGDLLPLLKADISIAVEYLQRHWDSALWQGLVAELEGDDRLQCLLQLAHTHPSCLEICETIPSACTALPHFALMLSHMQQYKATHTHSLTASHHLLYRQQVQTAHSLRRGKVVSRYLCAFCGLEIRELGLFRECGHHIHLECEIDENCRLCEKR